MRSAAAFAFCAIVCAVLGSDVPLETRPPKKYVVNLDEPDEFRWTQVVQDHREIVKDVHVVLRYILLCFLNVVLSINALDLVAYMLSKGIARVI